MFFQDYFTRTLRWLEPHGGWGDSHNYRFATDIRGSNNDTGFCNRLLHWELAYLINHRCNHKYRILVQYKLWPELDLLDLPETFLDYSEINNKNDYFWNYEYEVLKFKTVFDVKKDKVELAKKIDIDLAEKMFNSNDFSEIQKHKHWYSDFGFRTMTKINTSWYNGERPISKIKLKHQALQNIIDDYTNGTVGIHLRRFNGVTLTEKDYETIPVNLRDDLKKLNKNKSVVNTEYPWIPDSVYFEIIDSILKINPLQKFYLSSDLPIKYLKPFTQRYGSKIIHCHHFEREFDAYLYNANIDVWKLKKYANAILSIIDLFSLANCPFVIGNPLSTWSEFAYYYKPKYHCHTDNKLEEILDRYKVYNENKTKSKLL